MEIAPTDLWGIPGVTGDAAIAIRTPAAKDVATAAPDSASRFIATQSNYQVARRALNWTPEETVTLLKLRFKTKELLQRFSSQREKKDEDDNWELIAAQLPGRDSTQCQERLKTLLKNYKKLTKETFTATGNKKTPKYPVYWDFLLDCLAPFPGLRGLTIGGSHVETPEGAGGPLSDETPETTSPAKKKQKQNSKNKKTTAQTPVLRICDSIEKMIDKMSSRDDTAGTLSTAQVEMAALRTEISSVNSKVDKLADVVGELLEHLKRDK
ncbi:hypothetical protein DVH05_014767 [Phytophthora capsici]|nr:hypothetical protein DVH05_014767 [Phytophthora capsici]